MKFIVLTTDQSRFGFKLLNLLSRENCRPFAVVVQRGSWRHSLKLFRSVLRRIGFRDTLWHLLQRRRLQALERIQSTYRDLNLEMSYKKLAEQVFYVRHFSDQESLKILSDLQADFFLLGQTGILKNNVLQLAKQGVLNAHPGWLPYYRGVDLPYWTVVEQRFDRLGSSLHFVNEGVDTGPVVRVSSFQPFRWPEFDLLEQSIYEDCLNLLVTAAKELQLGCKILSQPQDLTQGRQYYKIPQRIWQGAKKSYDLWKDKQR